MKKIKRILMFSMCFLMCSFAFITASAFLIPESQYGTLIFYEDFENYDGEKAVVSGSTMEQKINSYFSADGFTEQTVRIMDQGQQNTKNVVKDTIFGSTKMFTLTTENSASNFYPTFLFDGFSITKPGQYTWVFDYYWDPKLNIQDTYAQLGTKQVYLSKHGKYKMVVSFDLKPDRPALTQLLIMGHGAVTSATPMCYDNFALYYKPFGEQVNVIITKGDSTDDIYSVEERFAGESIKLPNNNDYFNLCQDGFYLKGFYVGGVLYSPGATYKITDEDAQTGDFIIKPYFVQIPYPEYGVPIWIEDFGSYEEGTILSSGNSLTQAFEKCVSKSSNIVIYGFNDSRRVFTVRDVSDANNNFARMLEISSTDDDAYPSVSFHNCHFNKPGEYTFVFDYYVEGANSNIGGMMSYMSENRIGVPEFRHDNLIHREAARTMVIAEGETITRLGFHGVRTNLKATKYYVGNLMVYYKGEDLKDRVTEDSGSSAGTKTDSKYNSFERTKSYSADLFTDVPASEWYAASVKNTYELGLMNGTSQNMFSPLDNITVAEIITLTSRARAIVDGETIPEAEGEWYEKYVKYAVSKGFVTENQYSTQDFNRPATRKEVAVLFKTSMPEDYFSKDLNNVKNIPDVPNSADYYDKLVALYNAGILTGSDAEGTFYPDNNIIRAEVATMITRIAIPEKRVRKQPKATVDSSVVGAYTLLEAQKMHGALEREPSGWVLNNRGGIPTDSALSAESFKLSDISDSDKTVLTRKFNKVSDSVLELKTSITISGSKREGICLAYEDEKGNDVYRVALNSDNNWTYLNADGSASVIYETNISELTFKFVVVLDMLKNTATTYINDKDCGTYPLALPDTDIYAFRFGTLPETLGSIEVNQVNIEANYAINDSFSWDTSNTVPHGWDGDGAKRGTMSSTSVLKIDSNGKISKDFDALTGIVLTEFEFLAGDGVDVTLSDNEKNVLHFVTKDGKLYANDKEVYAYALNVWYRMRFEADTDSRSIIVKLNGRKIDEIPFKEACSSVNKLTLANSGKDTVYVDTVKVYRKAIHADYVPVPVIPEGYGEEYIMGINVCNIWRNDGSHYGWSPITPHEMPVLGYYDEGNPEAADWEIKYMVEHGIVYQSICWFVGESNAPLKSYPNVKHLHDGFMNAEYSDMMKYFINFEVNTNMVRPANSEAWRTYFVPAIIENYFKDDRYLVINNKPVFSVYSAGMLNQADCFGSLAGSAAEFEHLENEAKKLGFDGVIFVSSSTANDSLSYMGFDTALPYGYGNGVNTFDTTKKAILASLSNSSKLFTSPTVSVGFSSDAWFGEGQEELMSVEDFRLSHEWVKEKYLPSNAKKGTFQEVLVGNGTWNEYGEGNFIMPGLYNGGFGYLDVLRELYTKEKADPSINIIPTQSQFERINRMYPADLHLIKGLGYYSSLRDDSLYTVNHKVTKDSADKISFVKADQTFESEYAASVQASRDATYVDVILSKEIDLSLIDTVKVSANGTVGNYCSISARVKGTANYVSIGGFSYLDGMSSYYFDVSDKTDIIDCIRILPINGTSSASGAFRFDLEYLELLSVADKDVFTISIDGNTYNLSYPLIKTESGEYLLPFNSNYIPDRLGVEWDWDNDSKILTLKSKDHEVIFKVTGSDPWAKTGLITEKATKEHDKLKDGTKFLVDGVEMDLGYECYTFDGMPVIPLKKLCEIFGYKYDDSTGIVTVDTCHKFYYDIINNQVPGEWEFNFTGSTEGWVSPMMSLETMDGYMHCVSITNNTDPVMRVSESLDLSKYTKIEVRIRVDIDKEGLTEFSPYFYFITNKDRAWGENKKIKTTDKVTNHGDWAVLTYDLTAVENWKDTLVTLRFDPFDALGSCDIDYIRLIEG